MAASIIGTSFTDPSQLLKGFTVQDLPDHYKTKQYFPSTIMFACKSSSDLGSSIGVSLELCRATTKTDRWWFGRSVPSYIPSSEELSEK